MIARTFKIAVCILTASSLLFFTACHQKADGAGTPAYPSPLAKVRVEKATLESVTHSEEVVGTVRAKVRATLEAKQAGRIEKLSQNLGDTVRAGELIAELDVRENAARVEKAAASVEEAERDWKRVSSLFDAKSATRSERDAAESRVRVARAALAEAQANLDYMRIVAPFDGVVTRKWAEAGDLATPGKPLVEIENLSVLQVEIDIPESLSARVKLHSKLSILGDRGIKTAGVITELSPAVDPATRTRRAKIETKEGSLAPGQFVRVSIPIAEQKVILLPKAAVVERGQLEMVFTTEKQHARMHLVKARAHDDARMEILSGVSAGESVIVEGSDQLSDGQPVEVKQ